MDHAARSVHHRDAMAGGFDGAWRRLAFAPTGVGRPWARDACQVDWYGKCMLTCDHRGDPP
jgi:hypothetical protein